MKLLFPSLLVCAAVAAADEAALIRTLGEKGVLSPEEVQSLTPAQTLKPANRWVEDLRVRGRIQTQFGAVDAENDRGSGRYSTFEVRRAYIGLLGDFSGDVRSFVEINAAPGDLACTNAYLQWRGNRAAYVKVGYDKPLTSFEEVASSAAILTHERALITSTVAAPSEQPGVLIEGERGPFVYGLGVFTNQDNRNADYEQGYLYNGMAGIETGSWLAKDSTCRLQYHTLINDDRSGEYPYETLHSFGLHVVHGPLDFLTEAFRADSDGPVTRGFFVMPAWMLTSKLQGLIRYERAESDEANGLRAASRYARRVDIAEPKTLTREDGTTTRLSYDTGDEHQALLFGLNYYLASHGNKLMVAVELAELDHTRAGTLETTTLYLGWRTLF